VKGERRLDKDQLARYADDHLAREVEMLRWTGSFLAAFSTLSLSSRSIEGDIAQAFRESSLESFAIHSRNLIDFLYLQNYYRRARPTDIILEDYVAASVIKDKLIPITALLKDARIKADKLVAHLSLERETFGFYQKAWMFNLIAVDLLEALRSVVDNIPAGFHCARFRRSVSRSLPLFTDIALRQYSEDDERGPGLAMEFGMWHRPNDYGPA